MRRLGVLTGPTRAIATLALATGLALCGAARQAGAQEFGRNKVQYQAFDFQVLKTEHFDIYFYEDERPMANRMGQIAERWYARLAKDMRHQLHGRQPLILYASHPHFSQTNAISGDLGEGTGGVTETLKRRIVLPLAGPLQDTDHVFAHELVHAFQFDMTGQSRAGLSGGNSPAARLPLWFMEGMAEYMSLGPVDAHTAMWMRDAVQSQDLPTIRDLENSNKYFPYRYGQALWAYIGGRFGNESVADILKSSARSRSAQDAVEATLKVNADTLSRQWQRALKDWALPQLMASEKPDSLATQIIAKSKGAGDLNLGPVLSPDGTKVLFFSEKDLFSVELYVADAATGQILRKLTRTAVDPHFESLQFIYSAGAWSPDGSEIALGAVNQGQPILSIVSAATGKPVREFKYKELGQVLSPAWSADGKWIAFSAQVDGVTDLYVAEVATGRLTRLTHDAYADLQPTWAPDGRELAFVTDRFTTDLATLRYGNLRLANWNAASGAIREIGGLPFAKNINPQFAPDGSKIYFISDAGGVSNLFTIAAAGGEIRQLTHISTGISGLTETAPALSVAPRGDRLVFSAYQHGHYNIYAWSGLAAHAGEVVDPNAIRTACAPMTANLSMTTPALVTTTASTPPPAGASGATTAAGSTAAGDTTAVATASTPPAEPADAQIVKTVSDALRDPSLLEAPCAATLPPTERTPEERLWRAQTEKLASPDTTSFTESRYRPRLSVDYISQPSFAVGASSQGVAVGGGSALYWSDMLGNQNLLTLFQFQSAGGKVLDNLGLLVGYENRAQRWDRSFTVGQIPYITHYYAYDTSGAADSLSDLYLWQINRQAIVSGSYPLSQVKRIEVGGGFQQVSFSSQVRTQAINPITGYADYEYTRSLDTSQFKPYAIATASAALVHDTSIFGGTSPVSGQRYRLEVSPSIGGLQYVEALADYRRYLMVKRPVSIAGRFLHFGRYGRDSDSERLSQVYLGYQSLIRGYDYGSFTSNECVSSGGTSDGTICPTLDQLYGSRVATGNLEARVPLLGALGLLPSPGIPPVELAAFFDAGVAWDHDTNSTLFGGSRKVLSSYGAAVRVNLFGFAVGEADLVHPNNRPGKGWYWQFGIQPGF